MTTDFAVLQRTIDTTNRQIENFDRCGQPRPEWLEKKIAAVETLSTDWNDGVAKVIDALQDEREALGNARYTPYHPGETS